MGLFIRNAGKTDSLLGLIEKSAAICHRRGEVTLTFPNKAIEKAELSAEKATGERPDYRAQLASRFPDAEINGNIVVLRGSDAVSFDALLEPAPGASRQR